MENSILLTDSYKLSHWKMYPPEMEHMTSYLEARNGGAYPETVFFGLQYLLKKHFVGLRLCVNDINKAAEFCKLHFGRDDIFNTIGWVHILRKHDGYLPLRIRAVPEGSIIPESNVLLTVENTCRECAWLVNHFETILVQLWYPCTVATISYNQKQTLLNGLQKSSESFAMLPFMLHDFGYRGSTSQESAAIGGAAHLVNFVGTDNIAATQLLSDYYNETMAGFSIPAAEHSTICVWGEEREVDAYRHILQNFDSGLVAVVSDSYDIYNAIDKLWGGTLYNYVSGWGGRNVNRTLIVRPDSGDPTVVVPECLNLLGKNFGYSVNNMGYKVLPECVKMIQGDGISRHSLPEIVESILDAGWSLENMAFGSGGGLLQDCNRDTLRFAMKASAARMRGDPEWKEVFKSPRHDVGKASKKGYLYLSPTYTTTSVPLTNDVLRPVFENGTLLIDESFDTIRKRLM